jgi:hypothetical protein
MAHPRDASHARIYRHWLELPAWQTLKPAPRALLVDLLTRYRPMEPNAFEVSDRTAAIVTNCSRGTARLALADLEDRGWIKVIRVGRMIGPKGRRASVYTLTAFPETLGALPTKEFERWQPHPCQRLKTRPSTDQIRPVNGSIQVRKEELH